MTGPDGSQTDFAALAAAAEAEEGARPGLPLSRAWQGLDLAGIRPGSGAPPGRGGDR